MNNLGLRLVLACSLILLCDLRSVAMTPRSASKEGSEAYYKWVKSCLSGISKDMPGITRSAEEAARRFVLEDYEIGAWGDAPFVQEFTGRAGGIMPIVSIDGPDISDKKVIVLMNLHEERLPAELEQARKFRQQGYMVIAFARKSLLQAAGESGSKFDAVVDTHAAEHDGLFQSKDGTWVVPTEPTANLAALWAWSGEFVGACTRLGKMPPMWQSFCVPGARERDDKFLGIRFHDGKPVPVVAGKIGREYLRETGKLLTSIHNNEMSDIRALAVQAAEARQKGNAVYIFPIGHALSLQMGCTRDPGYFVLMGSEWKQGKIDLKTGDLVFFLGYDGVPEKTVYVDFPAKAREAGVKLFWSRAVQDPDLYTDTKQGETIINQYWKSGDAAVSLPGYDVNILPPQAASSPRASSGWCMRR